MIWRALIAIPVTCCALLMGGCARDVNVEGTTAQYPLEVTLGFKTDAPLDTATWYYMVFNFTAAPSTALNTAPMDIISNEDRGANWELYVVLKRTAGGEDQLLTLQRPRVPTILPVTDVPVDTAVADFNGDEMSDLAVACNQGNAVQLLTGRPTEIFNNTFFDDAVTIHEAPAPFRIHAADMTGNSVPDLVLLGQGDTPDGAYLRVLENDGSANFTSLGDTPVSGIPVDAVITDLNGNGFPDVAVVTVDEANGAGTLRVFISAEGGGFDETYTADVGTDPSSIAAGDLDGNGVDLVVGTRGAASANGSVYYFVGDGTGQFADPQVLDVDGKCSTVSIGRMYGNADDVVVGYTDSSDKHYLGVFQNEPDEPLAGPPDTTEISIEPQYAVAQEVSGDNHTDVLVVNGTPGSGGNQLIIKLGDRENVEGSQQTTFKWADDEINYLVGTEASRIKLADVDGNGVPDIIMPDSGLNDQNIYSVGVFYGLGKANFTSADLYWTDFQPEPLTTQDWYINHRVGPNFFELTLDPALFYDLARQPPDEFLVDFMTGTTGIDLDNNPDQLGEIQDHLSSPVNVPMTIGFYNDEQNNPLANTEIATVASEDIVDWRVEVF